MPERRARIFRADDTDRRGDDGIVFDVVGPEQTGAPELLVGRFASAPGFEVPPHHHTCDTIAYLIRGRALFRIGDDLSEVLEMQPGEYVYVPAGVIHTEETVGDDEAEFILARDRAGGETIYRD